MRRALVLLFAVAGGSAVANLYWAQPLLEEVAADLGTSGATAGLLVTVTQVGYALGILLVVPLGDVVDRRLLVPLVLLAAAAALVGAALAPGFAVLAAALVLVGLTTVAGQLLTPLAGDLAGPDERGRVVGVVASGLLTGILVSRTVAGFVAEALGWRSLYLLAAGVAVVMAVLLRRAVPRLPPRERVAYGALLASVLAAVRTHRAAPVTLLIGGCCFGVFTAFWTALTLLLSAPPYAWSLPQIGLVGLVGLAGALAAQRAGRLHDRGWSVPATGAGLVLVAASLVLALAGGRSLAPLLVAVALLDVAVQGVGVLNQTRLLALDPRARSRLNTAYVVGNFAGGAVGSAMASALWRAGQWPAVVAGMGALVLVALVAWATTRRGALVTAG